jgi:hypothetical protein
MAAKAALQYFPTSELAAALKLFIRTLKILRRPHARWDTLARRNLIVKVVARFLPEQQNACYAGR